MGKEPLASDISNKKTDKQLIYEYFTDPIVVDLLLQRVGPDYKIKVFWEADVREVVASGAIGIKRWDIDFMLASLRGTVQ